MGKRKKGEEEDGDYEGAGGDDDDNGDDDNDAFVPESAGGDDDDDVALASEKSEDEKEKEPPKKKQKTSKTTSKKKGDDDKEEKKTTKKKAPAKKAADKGEKETKSKKSDSKAKKPEVKGGKAKVTAIKSEPEARKVIFDYLQNNNSPFSIQNIIDNLHGLVKKAVTQKALDKLVESGKITLKEQGKTKKVYMLNQDGLEVFSNEELAAIDEEIKNLKQQKQSLVDEIKELNANKDKASKALTNEELDERIAQLQKENEEQKKDLERLSTVKLATPEEKKAALANLETFLKEWRSRKRKAMDIAEYIAENANLKPKALMEELDIETDEVAGVDIGQMGK